MKILPRVFRSAPYRIFLICLSILRLPPASGDGGMLPVVPLVADNDDGMDPTRYQWGSSIDVPTWFSSDDGAPPRAHSSCPSDCMCNPLDKGALPSYSVECKGEHITSIDQIELPEKTVHLFLTDTGVEQLSPENFANLTMLTSIMLKQNSKLRIIEPGTFSNLNEITGLGITYSSQLKEIGPGVFGDLPRLESLSLDSCGLESVPNLTTLHTNDETLKKIILSNNKIFSLKPHTFSGMPFEVYNVDLSNNDISSVYGKAFDGAIINKLILSNNPITYIEDNIFEGIVGLLEVHLAGTRISKLPTLGLKNIILLDIQNTPNLKHFPPLFKFENIQTARLHYFSHCCAFIYNTSESQHMAKMQNITEPIDNPSCSTTPNPSAEADDARNFFIPGQSWAHPVEDGFAQDPRGSSNTADEDRDSSIPRGNWARLVDDDFPKDPRSSMGRGSSVNFSSNSFIQPPPDSLITNSPSNMQPDADEFVSIWEEPIDPNTTHRIDGDTCSGIEPKDYSKVNCTPRPDAFNPCSDVMGYPFLRVVVWFIASTAMVGNLIVMVVLIAYRHKMTVPKFLMCNLAFADFCMGIYLLIIASVDVYTLRVYFNYAIDWQFGAGCKIAGFISVFSSELSVFTLTVLTIERWYTIIYAIDLNKRIRLRQAGRILLGGWLFAVIIASLPFFGFAAYGVTSMCLPFYVRTSDGAAAVAYVIFILLFNALAFIVICACYIKMYVTVRNPHSAMQRKDSKVAKRMAVLIFTDLACWAPIAINGLSSIFQDEKHGFLTTDQSKVFIVLFYPINSCANPFLYAIFTRAFRRDMFLLLAKHGMCEKRAMKYRPTCTSSPRSLSQVNSTTIRDVIPKGSHRGSSASVMTQITSEARPSMVSYDKDSPDNSPKTNIELQLVVTMGSNSLQNQPTVVTTQNQWDIAPLAPIASNKVGGGKKPNEHVYVVDGLPPVPEELNGDRQEIPSDSPTSKTRPGENQRMCRRQISPQIVEHCITEDHNEDDPRSKESSSLLPHAEGDQELPSKETRKNSRADSGIQSVSTTPTDRDVTSKALQMNLGRSDDFETSL